ncbi:MAG: hypothetical protein KDD37_05625 [Bdellovibrionales bacterium]|nr:hypothetical protein [Bdellovibrionales bacterium]
MKYLFSLLAVLAISNMALAANTASEPKETNTAITIAKVKAASAKASAASAVYAELLLKRAIVYSIELNEQVNRELGLNNLQPREIAIPAAFGVAVADAGLAVGSWKVLNALTPSTSTKSWVQAHQALERQARTIAKALRRAERLNNGSPRTTEIVENLVVRDYGAKLAVRSHLATRPSFRAIGRGIRHGGRLLILTAGLGVVTWATSDAYILQLSDDGAELKNKLNQDIAKLERAFDATITEDEVKAVTIEVQVPETAVSPAVNEDAAKAVETQLDEQATKDVEARMQEFLDAVNAYEQESANGFE